jgi:hypothetical protein
MSINVWRLAENALNITCNFLYCNHQVHRDGLITLYDEARLGQFKKWNGPRPVREGIVTYLQERPYTGGFSE